MSGLSNPYVRKPIYLGSNTTGVLGEDGNFLTGSFSTPRLNPNMNTGIFGDLDLSGLKTGMGNAYDTMAGWGQSALKFGDQYGKGITEGLKAFSALKGMSNQKRQLKDARENADYLRKASNADISSRAEAQGTKRALQMGSSLEDAYKKGADYSNERMAQWGLK